MLLPRLRRLGTRNHRRNEKRNVDTQRGSKALEVVDRDIPLLPLDGPYKRPMKPGSLGKLLLGDAAFRANDT